MTLHSVVLPGEPKIVSLLHSTLLIYILVRDLLFRAIAIPIRFQLHLPGLKSRSSCNTIYLACYGLDLLLAT